MWRTPAGTRTLRNLESRVVLRGLELETAIELIELGIAADAPWEFEVAQFDALTPEQQLALLAEVGRALFYKSVSAPVHTAVNEAGVYAIFRALLLSIQFEIDGESVHDVESRRLVYDLIASDSTADESENGDAGGLTLTPGCCDIAEWEFEVECVADRILWDRDFELEDSMADSSPEKAQHLKTLMGIDEDYFATISPDPKNLAQVWRTLKRLLHRSP